MKNLWPDPLAYPAERLFCLDVLRGLDIFFLTMLGPFVKYGWFKVFKPSEAGDLFWKHSLTSFASPGCVPTGWGIWDFGQPLFIFICGAAVPFAIPRRLDVKGRPTAAFWKHVLGRFVMLWCLGMLIRGILTFDLSKFTPYSDTLQTIAVAYLFAALSMLIRRRWLRFVLALLAIGLSAVVMEMFGDYTRLGNVARLVDEAVFGAIGAKAKDFCYVFTTIVWGAMGVLGALTGEIVKAKEDAWIRAAKLAVWGMSSYAFGRVLGIWIPPIRYIYTVSFVFQSLGLSILCLDVLFVLTDILRWRRGLGFFLLMGQFTLFMWMLSTFFRPALTVLAKHLVCGLPMLAGTDRYQPIAEHAAIAVIMAVLAILRYRASVRTNCETETGRCEVRADARGRG